MRLSPNKIEYLADRILTMMQEDGKVHLTAHVETVWKTIADTIFANMREEEEIDARSTSCWSSTTPRSATWRWTSATCAGSSSARSRASAAS